MLKRKPRLLSVLLVLCLAVSLFAGITPAAIAAGSTNSGVRHELCTSLSQQAKEYYSGEYSWENMCTLRGTATDSSLKAMDSELYDALQELMDETMTRSVSYKSLTDYWKTTDACKGANNAVLFYSDFVSSSYNREHVWPKSRGSFYQKNAGSDLHHLRPTDNNVNSTRGNHTMGDVVGVLSSYSTLDNGGKTVLYYNASRDLVEVNDNIKGDVARILLYVYVRWGQPNLCENVSSANLPRYDSDDSDNNGIKVIEDLDTLLAWCAGDPVDTWEMSRNDCVQNIQGNRNVFIDYPEYAWLLFGREIPADMKTPAMHDVGTVTYKINAVSADESCGSVSCALRTVTAQPEEGYMAARAEVYPATAAEISQNGNVFTLKNVKADCTVKVFFEKIRQVTLSFAAPCEIDPMTAPMGSKALLPECTATVDGYRFAGWAEKEINDTETAPTYYAAGTSYTLSGDTTLYALYARTEKGGTGGGAQLVTSAPADWTGSYVIGVPAKGVMMNNDGSGKTYLDRDDADIEGGSITNATADNYFTLKKVGNAYSIQDSSGAYLRCGGAKNVSLDSGKTAVTASDTAYLWEVSVGGISAVTASYGRLQYNASAPRFTTYTSAQNAVSLYRLGEADKIFYSTFATAEHVHNYTAAVTKPTCTEGGYTTYTCACGESYVDNYVEAIGHNYVDGKCTVCGAADPDYKPVINAGKLLVSDACARAGEEVTVSVSIEDNPGIMVMALGIDYDRSKLKLAGYEDGIMSGWTVANNAVWIGSEDVTADGIILKLKFRVLEDVEDGDIQISMLFSEGDIANHNEDVIMPGVSNGTVSVYSAVPGDISGDGKVNALDLLRLQKYLAGEDVEICGSCDISGDGKVNALDLLRLQRFLSGEDIAIF